jgi:hypothetical protein
MTSLKLIILSLLFLGFYPSCGIYSYPSEPFHYETTVSIGKIKNNVNTQDPLINFLIKEKLENKFKTSKRRLVDKNGDLQIIGEIANYQIAPFGININEKADYNRITIKMKIEINNKIDNRNNGMKTFVDFVDLETNKNIWDVRDSIHNLLAEKLTISIFDYIMNDW